MDIIHSFQSLPPHSNFGSAFPIHPPVFLCQKIHREKEHRCWVTPPNAAQLPPSWVSRKNVSRPKARYTQKMLQWNRGRHFWIWAKDLIYIFENNGKNNKWKKATQTLVVASFFLLLSVFFGGGDHGCLGSCLVSGYTMLHTRPQRDAGHRPPANLYGNLVPKQFLFNGKFLHDFPISKKNPPDFFEGRFFGLGFLNHRQISPLPFFCCEAVG